MPKSTTKRRKRKDSAKPAKPRPNFPLTPHPKGYWCKKIRGRIHYFGRIADDADGKAALDRFDREWPYLKDGRTPPPIDTRDGLTVRDLCNAFLTSCQHKLSADELTERTFREYRKATDRLVSYFGRERRVDDLRPDDFAAFRRTLAKTRGPTSLGNEIQRVRTVFKFAFDNGLIDNPVRYGTEFRKPPRKSIRLARHANGRRMFEAEELRKIIDTLNGKAILRAFVLLGVNCGFGATDIGSLPSKAVDLDGGWIDFPRPKTGIDRRIPLWPETVEALDEATFRRPKPKDPADAGLVFITKYGKPWVRFRRKDDADPGDGTPLDSIGPRFARLLRKVGLKRPGLNFYALRHTFRTIADEARDQPAANAIMGHADESMSALYRERISDDRLRAVTDHVRAWLFPPEASG